MTDTKLHIIPLGDQAAQVNLSTEDEAIRFAARVRAANADWLIDVVQAYTSVAVFFEIKTIRYLRIVEELQRISTYDVPEDALTVRRHEIPCCYEWQQDMARIVEHTGLDSDAIIDLHCETEYTVYAIGFCPGFPYLGYLPEALSGVPRLPSPRVRVEAGSVALTGRQTGIYTEDRPGGWNILGKTPLQLVDVADEYFPLRTGDKIRFRKMDKEEYQHLLRKRL